MEDYIRSRPEIVFEIVSRYSFQKDEEIKFHLFGRERVPYYVLVYPNIRKVRVYKLVITSIRFSLMAIGKKSKF